jgi:hypothetical protein
MRMSLTVAAAGIADLVLIPSLAASAAIFAQVIGVPVARLKLRRTDVGANATP